MVSVPSSLSVAAMSLISSPVTALLDFPAMTAEYTVSPSVGGNVLPGQVAEAPELQRSVKVRCVAVLAAADDDRQRLVRHGLPCASRMVTTVCGASLSGSTRTLPRRVMPVRSF